MLDRDAGMRPLMLHGRDDAGLAVAPFDGADTGGAPQRRVLPVGGGHEPRAELRAIGQPNDSAAFIRGRRGHGARREQLEARQDRGAVEQRAAQHPVLDDIAERRGAAAQIVVVVVEEQGRVVVGDADLADRLGLALDRLP